MVADESVESVRPVHPVVCCSGCKQQESMDKWMNKKRRERLKLEELMS